MLIKNWIEQKKIMPNPRKWDKDRLSLFVGEQHSSGGSDEYTFEGHKSFVIVTGDGSYTHNVIADISTHQYIEICIYIPEPTKVSSVIMYVYAGSQYAHYALANLELGWNRCRVRKDAANFYGGLSDWSSITSIKLDLQTVSEQTTWISVSSVEALNLKSVLSIHLDDGHATVFTEAKPIMDKYGLVGCANINTGDIGDVNRMTIGQLKELQMAGWDINNHTQNHINLSSATEEDIIADLTASRAWLKKHGFHQGANFLIAPYGASLKARHPLYFQYCKAFRSGLGNISMLPSSSFAAEDYVSKFLDVTNDATPTTITGYIDNLISSGGLMNLCFHYLVDPASVSTQYTPTNFETVMAYIATKRDAGELEVLTFSDIYYHTKGFILNDDEGAILWGIRNRVPVAVDLEI